MSIEEDTNKLRIRKTCSFLTKGKYELFEMSWTIENYAQLQNTLEYICSPTFPSKDRNADFEWYLHLSAWYEFSEKSLEFEHLLDISLNTVKGVSEYAEVSISVTNNLRSYKCLNFKGILPNITGGKLYLSDSNDNDQFLISSDLTVHCAIKVLLSLKDYEQEEKMLKNNENNVIYKLMLNDKTFTDFTFYVKHKKFDIHKAVFAVQSSVFAAIFQSKMKEGISSSAIIDGEAEIFEKLINFIYSGVVDEEDLDKYSGQFLDMAQKYNLDKLKMICANYLYGNVSSENVLEMLVLSDLHRLDELKKKALVCLLNNKNKFKDSEDYKNMLESRPHLIMDLLQIDFAANEKNTYSFVSESTYMLREGM